MQPSGPSAGPSVNSPSDQSFSSFAPSATGPVNCQFSSNSPAATTSYAAGS